MHYKLFIFTNKKKRTFFYLQKLSKVVCATWVTFKSWYDSSSSSNIILTTTTWIELPIVGSLYKADTIFIIVSKYASTSTSLPSWNCTIVWSATTNASTWRGVTTERVWRFLEFFWWFLFRCWCWLWWFLTFRPPWTIT